MDFKTEYDSIINILVDYAHIEVTRDLLVKMIVAEDEENIEKMNEYLNIANFFILHKMNIFRLDDLKEADENRLKRLNNADN